MKVIKRKSAHLRSFTPVDIYAPNVFYKVKCPRCRSKLEFQRSDLELEIRKEMHEVLSLSVNYGYRYRETSETAPLSCQKAPDGYSFTGNHIHILSAKCPICDNVVASLKKTWYLSIYSKDEVMKLMFGDDSAYNDPLSFCRKLTLTEKIALRKRKSSVRNVYDDDDDYDSGEITDDDDDGIDVVIVEVSSDDDDDDDYDDD